MNKNNWKTALKLEKICKDFDLEFVATVEKIIRGEATFDGENLINVAPKLSKRELLEQRMQSGALSSIERVGETEQWRKLTRESLSRIIKRDNADLVIDNPKIFNSIMNKIIDEIAEKPWETQMNLDSNEAIEVEKKRIIASGVTTIPKNEVMESMRQWAIDRGITLTN